jgi:hypothetical protein
MIKTAAASHLRTPLAEFTVRAFMFLIAGLFERAEESIGRHFKTHSPLIDKSFFILGHSKCPPAASFVNWKTFLFKDPLLNYKIFFRKKAIHVSLQSVPVPCTG